MSVACVLIFNLVLVITMVQPASARRPQISSEELFQKSTSSQSGPGAAVAHGNVEPPSLSDGRSGSAAAVASSSCFFNRDCHVREFCVKPNSGVLTLGVCSLLPDAAPARRAAASDHVRDLHFLVRNRRSVPASWPLRDTNDLLRRLLGEESQLARSLNSYLRAKYAVQRMRVLYSRSTAYGCERGLGEPLVLLLGGFKHAVFSNELQGTLALPSFSRYGTVPWYPNKWKEVSLGRRYEGQDRAANKASANAAEINMLEDTVDPDLLAILDKGIRIEDAASPESPMNSSSAKQRDFKDANKDTQAQKDKQNNMVVDVKEGDMAIGPKRRPVTRSPNWLLR
ncbi:hypothetical protein HPB51_023099 [Rhipicephalus microplus]|uniref:Uncharacterized protein n=1 Tax=Rhipicephalus microplus TaxID=6941 RepID=A0A9J6DJ36_RHIMP|nr:hypothetical protein HPB51_023099 [Rhipicephalus microplus]